MRSLRVDGVVDQLEYAAQQVGIDLVDAARVCLFYGGDLGSADDGRGLSRLVQRSEEARRSASLAHSSKVANGSSPRSGRAHSDRSARFRMDVWLSRRRETSAEAIRIAHEVQELEADLSAIIYITMTADHFIASGRLAGHFPAELRSPSNGFGLPILTSIR